MWRNGRFTSWMCRRQICSNCVMLSWQYGPTSLRNVSNTLLNLCHEELKPFLRQMGVQPGTSNVYLIKWPVSVCTNIYIYIYTHSGKKIFDPLLILYVCKNAFQRSYKLICILMSQISIWSLINYQDLWLPGIFYTGKELSLKGSLSLSPV